ncbi:MAG: hypothetical protein PHH21_02225 [Candidatus Pacebacteria bacterium]|nr:hypothetical protein [Candidatus Paceibacterota bacterium]
MVNPEEAFEIIKESHIEDLRQCLTVEDRYDKLMELFPESILWGVMEARELVYLLYIDYQLDFGVCRYFSMTGLDQHCSATGDKVLCTCVIPQNYCVVRDRRK